LGNDPTIAVASFLSRVAFNIARHPPNRIK
jgi:hypothetical protein